MTVYLKAKNTYEKYRELIFLIVFMAYYSSLIFRETILETDESFSMLFGDIRKICYLCIVGIAALNTLFLVYTKRDILVIGAISVILLIIAWASKDVVTLVLWILMWCAKDISFKKIIKSALITSSSIIILMFVLSNIGIVEDKLYQREQVFSRHSFGFQYTTNIANLYLPILLMYSLLRKQIKLIELTGLFLINIFIFYTTDTKSAFAFGILILIAFIICRTVAKKGIFSNFILYISIAATPAALVLCLALQYWFAKGNEIASKINTLVSGRLYLADNGIKTYGIHLLGQPIEWITEDWQYNYIDSSFMQYLLNFGAIYVVLAVILYIWFGIKAKKGKNMMAAAAFVIIAGHSIFDPQMMWLCFNPLLLYAFAKDDTV